jgi:hypothetical protein
VTTADDKPAPGSGCSHLNPSEMICALSQPDGATGGKMCPCPCHATFEELRLKVLSLERELVGAKAALAASGPCPFWDDGRHSWIEERVASDGFRGKPMMRGHAVMGVKSCACGAEVFGKAKR